jgi:glycosyltransferase involved in cell wall biosynthesis
MGEGENAVNIAFVSYEYPPDTAFGGIATYVRQAATMLRDRGHHVEVFVSGPRNGSGDDENGIRVHRVAEANRLSFADAIAPVFAARHTAVSFDVLEGPEYFADARGCVAAVPNIALVVKLHTPSYVLWRMNEGSSRWRVLRHRLGSLLRGIHPYWHPRSGVEYAHACQADEIATPTKSLGELAMRDWGIPADRISFVPNAFTPPKALLEISPDTRSHIVTYIGRLEVRKGVLDLARAVPRILTEHPNAIVRFVGRSTEIKPGVECVDRLNEMLRTHGPSVQFPGAVPADQIPRVLAETDVCVFPSIWENFPNVCLEAMAAARGVVGSSAGGMAEMLADDCGVLVPPHRPERIADAVCGLLTDPQRRMEMGRGARQRVISEYHADRIAAIQEACYEKAIARRHSAGARRARSSSTTTRDTGFQPVLATRNAGS